MGDPHAPASTWPADWFERKAGRDCPLCARGRADADEFGVRIFAGECSDAYLQREAVQPDVLVEPTPEQVARGADPQVEKAVDVLRQDVLVWKKQRSEPAAKSDGAAPASAGNAPAVKPGGSH